MHAETPRPVGAVIENFDCASLQFDHEIGGFREANEGIYNLLVDTAYDRGRLGALGQPQVCPPCSYFEDGRCHWCPGTDDPDYPLDYPECDGCKGREKPKPPWYRRSEVMVPLVTAIAVSTVATVASTIILRRVGYKG